MSSESTSATFIPLPPDAKKALKIEAAKRDKTMGDLAVEFVTEKLMDLGSLPRSKKDKPAK